MTFILQYQFGSEFGQYQIGTHIPAS